MGKGHLIGPAEIGLLATVACKTIEVVRKPTVAVLSTGDELLDFDSDRELHFGEIRDANRPMLLAACQERGFKTIDGGIVKDSEEDIKKCIEDLFVRGADVLICSGFSF